MYDGATVAVVVPAYNEAGFVTDVVDTIPDFVDRVIVVDDCSTDETWAEIQAYVRERHAERTAAADEQAPVSIADGSGISVADGSGTSVADGSGRAVDAGEQRRPDDRIVPVRHRTNRGRGAAVKTGYDIAVDAGADVVAVMDGDGQMDPGILDRIVEPVVEGEADYAKGNRLVDRDHLREMSNFRVFGNLLLTALTCIASGHWGMRDPQNGYTAIATDALERLSLDDLFDGYGFLNDVLVHLGARGMDVVDVPMRAVYGDESSGIRYGSFVPQLSALLLYGFCWRLWTTYVGGESLHG